MNIPSTPQGDSNLQVDDGGLFQDLTSKENQEPISSLRRPWDPLQGLDGPMTRARAKRMKEALSGLIQQA